MALLDSHRGRVFAAVFALVVGLPILFFVLRHVLPDPEPGEPPARIDFEITDAETGAPIEDADVRVFRPLGGAEATEVSVRSMGGSAPLSVRPALARSETALVSVVAKGYEAYRERLAVLLRDAPSVAGERIVAVKLTPEDG